MKKIIFAFTLFVSLLNAEVITKTNVSTANGEGYGAIYDEALSKALADAVGRMNGVKLSASTFMLTSSIQDGKDRDFEKIYSDQISKQTGGRFDSYEVLKNVRTPDGYNVAVEIKKTSVSKKYKTPGLDPNNRRRLAVMPGYVSDFSFEVNGEYKSSIRVADDITRSLVTAITKTRKFTVLDRENSDAYYREKAVLSSGNAEKEELLKLGNVLGADYLLVFDLEEFSLSEGKASTITTGKASGKKASVRIHYRVLAMATRQVKFSNDIAASFSVKGDHAYALAVQDIAKAVTDEIIASIYPLKISSVSGDEILIAQNLRQGDVYEVYSLGQTVIDPYTKEVVGKEETMTAKAEVTRVTPKMSYLKLVSGSAKAGDICRLVQGSNIGSPKVGTDAGGREDNVVKQTAGGGVVLPF